MICRNELSFFFSLLSFRSFVILNSANKELQNFLHGDKLFHSLAHYWQGQYVSMLSDLFILLFLL